MSARVLIRLKPDTDGRSPWLRSGDGATENTGFRRDTLWTVAREAVGCRVTVLVSATDVLLTHVSLPVKNRQRLIKAIPFALEEQLASDIDAQHFALGQQGEDGHASVAVVSRSRMDHWLEQLGSAGIVPHTMVPEVLAVPWSVGNWSILPFDEDVLVRTGAQDGFAVEAENLVAWLSAALEEAGEQRPDSIHVYGSVAAADLNELDVELVPHTEMDDPMEWLAVGIGDHPQLNLKQGLYGTEEKIGLYFRPWRPVAAVLAVWLVIQGFGVVLEGVRLERERQQLSAQIEGVFRDSFPSVKRVVNAKVQMERGLADLRKSRGSMQEDFIRLLIGGAKALRRLDDIEVRRIRYQSGRLDLELALADMSGLEPLREALSAEGTLQAKVVSAASREGVVEGKIRITGKGK